MFPPRGSSMRIRLLTAMVATCLLHPALAAEWVVEVPYGDRAELARAAKHFQHLEVDRARGLFRALADDHGIVRRGLRSLLESEEGVTVVAEASDGLEALRLSEEHQPEILIVDIAMPMKIVGRTMRKPAIGPATPTSNRILRLGNGSRMRITAPRVPLWMKPVKPNHSGRKYGSVASRL